MAFPRVGVGGENRRGATLSHGRFPVEKARGMPAADCPGSPDSALPSSPLHWPERGPRPAYERRTVMTKGIHTHKVFKLGKASAKRDKRNLRFATLVRKAALPKSYDFDVAHPGIPTPMFANDVYGDCVVAGRAHQTLRFERIEQGSVLMITDKNVLAEYLKET